MFYFILSALLLCVNLSTQEPVSRYQNINNRSAVPLLRNVLSDGTIHYSLGYRVPGN